MRVEFLLELLVGVVDAELLKAVALEVLKAVDVLRARVSVVSRLRYSPEERTSTPMKLLTLSSTPSFVRLSFVTATSQSKSEE